MTAQPNPMSTPDPWQLVAEGYAAETAWLMEPLSLQAAALLAPASSARVLDVAAGPGTLALRLAAQVREMVAVDFSERMVSELVRASAAAGLHNLKAQVGDGQALAFANDEFDAAFSLFGLMFFADRARGFRELLRVLKPGAGAVVSSWASALDSSLMSAIFGALAAADPSFSAPPRDPNGLENPEILAAEMRAGGFIAVRVEPARHVIRSASAEDLWQRMARSSAPLCALRQRLGETEWQRRVPIIQRHLAGVLARQPELATNAWLAVGYKSK